MECIADICAAAFASNPKLATRQIVPLLGKLLGDAKLKTECAVLSGALVECLGEEGLREAASSLPPAKQTLIRDSISRK